MTGSDLPKDNIAIFDVHWSAKQPHDTKIGKQVLARNLDHLQIITADKSYDDDSLREWLRTHDIRPGITHREFTSLDNAHNARMNDSVYHQRAMAETAFFTMK